PTGAGPKARRRRAGGVRRLRSLRQARQARETRRPCGGKARRERRNERRRGRPWPDSASADAACADTAARVRVGQCRQMGTTKTFLLTVAALGAAALAGAACVVFGGLYDVAATTPHYQPVHTLLETAMRQSVRLRARD